MIDTLLAVGFAAATLAAVSSDDYEDPDADEESPTASAVSTLGVGMATTAAFAASAAHGHRSIESCMAQREVRAAPDVRHAAVNVPLAPALPTLASQGTYAASALASPH